MNYYDKDPKKGGKKIPPYKYFVQSGLTEKAIAEGCLINPTHDFNLLKAARLSLFEKHKLQFIDERTFNEVATTDQDLNEHYIAWLNNELDVIKQWLPDNNPTGKPRTKPYISNQIEIKKYWHFVVNEIETTELKVKTFDTKDEKDVSDTIGKGTLTKAFINDTLFQIRNDVFINDADYNSLVSLLTSFFDNIEYNLPIATINLKRGCKTKIAPFFNSIHKQLSENKLKNDTEYFKIIKSLNHFRNLQDIDIYKTITK